MSQEQSQVAGNASRYTQEEQLINSVRDVAGSWIAISAIGIIASFFVKGAFWFAPYLWAITSIWLWRSRSVAAARALLGIASAQFLISLYGKFVEPTLSLGLVWSAILWVAAIHAWRMSKALARYRGSSQTVAAASD